jgi:hypothetical protein
VLQQREQQVIALEAELVAAVARANCGQATGQAAHAPQSTTVWNESKWTATEEWVRTEAMHTVSVAPAAPPAAAAAWVRHTQKARASHAQGRDGVGTDTIDPRVDTLLEGAVGVAGPPKASTSKTMTRIKRLIKAFSPAKAMPPLDTNTPTLHEVAKVRCVCIRSATARCCCDAMSLSLVCPLSRSLLDHHNKLGGDGCSAARLRGEECETLLFLSVPTFDKARVHSEARAPDVSVFISITLDWLCRDALYPLVLLLDAVVSFRTNVLELALRSYLYPHRVEQALCERERVEAALRQLVASRSTAGPCYGTPSDSTVRYSTVMASPGRIRGGLNQPGFLSRSTRTCSSRCS